ncbi:protein FAM167A [Lingula anatina]|uniref:Protein FAM167A n=1 Tax=Lingula anatina TaxID=7574 RepID=A0A1S3K6A5_LINAN|nr:protein FAM167A [Lingula anatina]XP_013418042.1 protein FAM167A [Lingula anatina]XP_013418043.1 protein FAM167A [Lingula anatina]XP_013418044.1 protein FAM167A [Lingula anatina]XP_013418045.1 protein FAM167A [Lingula anatina]|eukprot:XP_013418041.1 protein FAM167A [Lingula anatina]
MMAEENGNKDDDAHIYENADAVAAAAELEDVNQNVIRQRPRRRAALIGDALCNFIPNDYNKIPDEERNHLPRASTKMIDKLEFSPKKVKLSPPIMTLKNGLGDGRSPSMLNGDYASLSPMAPTTQEQQQQGGLAELKAMTARLNLSTRRRSTVEWQEKHLQRGTKGKPNSVQNGLGTISEDGVEDSDHTAAPLSEAEQRISDALDWLREELTEMRSQDQDLARQLISLRHEIHQLKLQQSCNEHQEMLADARDELEDEKEVKNLELWDTALDTSAENPTPLRSLGHLGVTRMNLTSRRFSMR